MSEAGSDKEAQQGEPVPKKMLKPCMVAPAYRGRSPAPSGEAETGTPLNLKPTLTVQ